MALSPAERSRRYRARQRVKRGTAGMVLIGPGNTASRKHGAYAADVDEAAVDRLPGMPTHLSQPMFAEAVSIARRVVVRAERLGVWVAAMPEHEQITPTRPGASSPAETARQHDLAALNALSALGLTPASAARFGRALEESDRPDLALLVMQAQEAGEDSEGA